MSSKEVVEINWGWLQSSSRQSFDAVKPFAETPEQMATIFCYMLGTLYHVGEGPEQVDVWLREAGLQDLLTEANKSFERHKAKKSKRKKH